MVQERTLYIMREVMLGDVAAPQEWFETPTTSHRGQNLRHLKSSALEACTEACQKISFEYQPAHV